MRQAHKGSPAHRALMVAASVSAVLVLVKGAAWVMTGSLVVLASLLDSIGDTAMSGFNAWIHRLAHKSPDREHPFGHAGFEVIASLAQGFLLLGIAVWLAAQSISSLKSAGDHLLQRDLGLAIVLMAGSAVGGYLIHRMLGKGQADATSENRRSLAVLADQAHYAGDAWTNGLSAVGLFVIWATGWWDLDAILGLCGSLMIGYSAVGVMRHCLRDIAQSYADPKVQSTVVAAALGTDPRVQGIHRLRTRLLGPTLFVDFHMRLPAKLTLEDAHHIGEAVSAAIKAKIPEADVLIHLDPDTEPDDEKWNPAYSS